MWAWISCYESLCKITMSRTILFDLQIIYTQKKDGNKVSGSWNINFLLWLFSWNCPNDLQDWSSFYISSWTSMKGGWQWLKWIILWCHKWWQTLLPKVTLQRDWEYFFGPCPGVESGFCQFLRAGVRFWCAWWSSGQLIVKTDVRAVALEILAQYVWDRAQGFPMYF